MPLANIFKSHFSQKNPTKKEVKKAVSKVSNFNLADSGIGSIAVKIPAPQIAGIANKNENLAASLDEIPNIIPIVIVIPEREIPGKIAKACDIPIKKLFLRLKVDSDLYILFDDRRISPVIIKHTETIFIDSNKDKIIDLPPKPNKIDGMVAISKKKTNFLFFKKIKSDKTLKMSFLYIVITLIKVPKCVATSIKFPGGFMSNIS